LLSTKQFKKLHDAVAVSLVSSGSCFNEAMMPSIAFWFGDCCTWALVLTGSGETAAGWRSLSLSSACSVFCFLALGAYSVLATVGLGTIVHRRTLVSSGWHTDIFFIVSVEAIDRSTITLM